ncbi:MAG: helix-turn-helix transcriptional regulator [Armatimonadetes bacterium]|nr:helix-turn-helix transcriptional regulator [Armatimonadota bacterium]
MKIAEVRQIGANSVCRRKSSGESCLQQLQVNRDILCLIQPSVGRAVIRSSRSSYIIEQGKAFLCKGNEKFQMLLGKNEFEFWEHAVDISCMPMPFREEVAEAMPERYKMLQINQVIDHYSSTSAPSSLESLVTVLNSLLLPAVSPESSYMPLQARHLGGLEQLCLAVWKNPEREWTIAVASSQLQYSPFHFSRLFKSEMGMGFPEYVLNCRVRKVVMVSLQEGTELRHRFLEFGFNTQVHFRRAIQSVLGLNPSDIDHMIRMRIEAEV